VIIIFCKEISSMGKKFQRNHSEEITNYIDDCLKKFPDAEIIIKNWC
jgi:hypothetical protein